jgi:NTP pyrophosphatase (non-canonical NTP hydrolase)
MVFHNSDDSYRGVEPRDPHIAGSGYDQRPGPTELRDGLYYRSDIGETPDQLAARLLDKNWPASVVDFQYWTDSAWLAEHGTYPAVERFSTKLGEEFKEFADEIVSAEEGSKSISRDRAVEECGDVLWCATALASCLHADVDSGLKNSLFRYTMGVQHINARRWPVKPIWHDKAGALATKYSMLSFEDIDELIDGGFEPLPSPMMTLDESDRDDTFAHLQMLFAHCSVLTKDADEQFGRPNQGVEREITESGFEVKARESGVDVANIYLELAFLVHQAGSRLSEAMRTNIVKLTKRVNEQTLDKESGRPRSD